MRGPCLSFFLKCGSRRLFSLPPVVYCIESFDGDNELNMMNGSGRGILKVPPHHLPRGTKKYKGKFDYSSHYASENWNPIPLEYKSGILPPETIFCVT